METVSKGEDEISWNLLLSPQTELRQFSGVLCSFSPRHKKTPSERGFNQLMFLVPCFLGYCVCKNLLVTYSCLPLCLLAAA